MDGGVVGDGGGGKAVDGKEEVLQLVRAHRDVPARGYHIIMTCHTIRRFIIENRFG